MLSVFGTLNGSILSSPRVVFAIAEDGLFFRTVGKVHPKYETPYVAIGFIAVIAVISCYCATSCRSPKAT